MVVRGDGNHAVHTGEMLIVSAASSAFHVFDTEGRALKRLWPGNMVSSKT